MFRWYRILNAGPATGSGSTWTRNVTVAGTDLNSAIDRRPAACTHSSTTAPSPSTNEPSGWKGRRCGRTRGEGQGTRGETKNDRRREDSVGKERASAELSPIEGLATRNGRCGRCVSADGRAFQNTSCTGSLAKCSVRRSQCRRTSRKETIGNRRKNICIIFRSPRDHSRKWKRNSSRSQLNYGNAQQIEDCPRAGRRGRKNALRPAAITPGQRL